MSNDNKNQKTIKGDAMTVQSSSGLSYELLETANESVLAVDEVLMNL